MTSSAKRWVVIGLVLLASILPYAYTLNGDFVWDDDALILHNAFVQDIHQLPKALTSHFWNISSSETPGNPIYAQIYRPVVTLAYSLQFHFFDGKAPGFRVVSLLLHVLTTLLALRWFRRRFPEHYAWWPILVAGLMFAFHPTRPETVVWISGCTDLWMAFLALIGLTIWDQPNRNWKHAVLASLFFSLSLLAKEVAVVIPALLIADTFLIERFRVPNAWKHCALSVATMIASLVFRFWMVPLHSSAQATPVWMTIKRMLASYGYYVEITLWPWEPSGQRAIRYLSCAGEWQPPLNEMLVGGALLGTILVLCALVWRRPQVRPWLSDLLWFALPLLPVSNLMSLNSDTLVSERFLYLPLLGVGSLAARSLFKLARLSKVIQAVTWGVITITLLGFVIISTAHAGHFRWNRALWEYQAKIDPWNPSAAGGWAGNLYVQRRFNEAFAVLFDGYQRALSRCDIGNAITLALSASSQALGRTHDTDQETLNAVKRAYDGVLEGQGFQLITKNYSIIVPLKPKEAAFVSRQVRDFQIPRAIASGRTFHLVEAEEQLMKIVEENPRSAMGWKMLILISARNGNWDRAEQAIAEASARMPQSEGIERVAESMRAARAMHDTPVTNEIQRALRDSSVQVKLGSPEAARRILAPALVENPGHVELVTAYVSAMHEDLREDLALQAITYARAAAPERKEVWDELERRLLAAQQEQAPIR